ncbi:SDR family NAD(P)-dependent oxidoreductase [Egibacter rhizosphaerae]|uniref:SDR family NAD(P)-dependent oxidoreductase n=1 Tax=Egibacter rhizosphaerae TaxID=1670831 RepID=UPI0013F17100|nr:SDR family oxidoreductase [Egibacter rhizosphaerae]
MRTVIVTGATRGIGSATALELARRGWWVLATGRDAEEGADVEKWMQDVGTGRFVAVDLLEERAPEQVTAAALEATGRIDGLVNNAGVIHPAPLDELDMDVYDRLMRLNVRAAVALGKEVVPPMRRQGGGAIVNVSSEAGLVGFPGQVAYNISKAALVMLTKSIAADYASDGIRALTVAPGTTRTPLVDALIANAPDPGEQEAALTRIRPQQRLGTPEEVAAVIAFAMSDDAAFMTGTELVCDGGKTAV